MSPQPAGRRITTGFSYLQRIGKSGTFDVWFPEELKREIDERKACGETIGPKHFASQWAAVRQFELLHEAGNHKIYDLDPERLQRAMLDFSRSMRAGGYRMTVATLGRYEDMPGGDELEILDRRLQEGIAQMIHMLYLDETSNQANAENDARLALHQWDYRQDLPHIGVMLGARDLFQRPADDDEDNDISKRNKCGKKGGSGAASISARQHRLGRQFFDILNKLPQNHLVHDTAVGLQLPELNGENQWNYIADPEETLGAFNRILEDVFGKFNGISLSRLHGRENAQDEIKASTLHMRGYGDRLNESSDRFYRTLSLALN
jgi:hypothetical protein